jgi:hypothetical protein
MFLNARATPFHRILLGSSACVVLLCCSLRADTVTLTNGKVLEGRVTEEGDRIIIEMPFGVVKLNKSQVKSIVAKATPQDDLAARRAALEKKVADAKPPAKEEALSWFELARWAQEKELTHAYNEILRKVISLDPEHAGARKAQGYVEHNGRWVSRTERNQALGFVQVNGRWLSPEALKDLNIVRDDARRKELNQRKQELDLRAKQLEVQQREIESARQQQREVRAQDAFVYDDPYVPGRATSRVVYGGIPYHSYAPVVYFSAPQVYIPYANYIRAPQCYTPCDRFSSGAYRPAGAYRPSAGAPYRPAAPGYTSGTRRF